ncbi:unnamed protein product [Symbiodinium microadriaticum]|nr:unnamed protein product [Symbiodinium microadriaticum]
MALRASLSCTRPCFCSASKLHDTRCFRAGGPEGRIAHRCREAARVGQVNEELGKLRSDRAEFWYALHETSEEAVHFLRQANALPALGPAVVKRLDFEIEELCDDQKKTAEAFSELALRLKAAGQGQGRDQLGEAAESPAPRNIFSSKQQGPEFAMEAEAWSSRKLAVPFTRSSSAGRSRCRRAEAA